MQKDFITINDQDYRVEVNFDAVEMWEKLTGKKMSDFEEAAAMSRESGGGVATFDILAWLYCAVVIGEQLEGNTFKYDFKAFKSLCRPVVVAKFTPIFLAHYMDQTAPVKKKKNHLLARMNRKLKNLLPTRTQRRWYWVLFAGANVTLVWLVLRWCGLLYACSISVPIASTLSTIL